MVHARKAHLHCIHFPSTPNKPLAGYGAPHHLKQSLFILHGQDTSCSLRTSASHTPSMAKWEENSSWVFIFITLLLSFSAPFSLVASDLVSDSQALLGFLDGLVYASRVRWNQNVSPCTWQGVKCSPKNDSVWILRLPASGLYGPIAPHTLGLLSELRILSLRSNLIYGPLPSDLANLTQLRGLYLQQNSISGPLPSFQPSHILGRINLSFNKFNGSIPQSLNALPRLGTLLLQNNSLTGSIPNLALSNLAQFNVANNQLNGTIPSSLQKFAPSAFSGNHICGQSPFPPCPKVPVSPTPTPSAPPSINPPLLPQKKSKKLSTLHVVAIVVGVAAVLFLISLVLLLCLLRKCSPRDGGRTKRRAVGKGDDSKEEFSSTQDADGNNLVFLNGGGHTFDLEDLLRASAEVLGKGSMGTSYKAMLEDGSTVVVKRLKDVVVGKKEYEQQMEVISKLKHKNLVPVKAYYYSKEEKLLVLDYLPNGSLSALLHGNKGTGDTSLDWDTRLKIAVDASRTIVFLHEQGGNKFTHGNIKSSNILLNEDYDACISDFGLASLCSPAILASRMVGYRAPEVTETRKMTHKSDVYSFGVLLLELLTGKVPSETSTEEGVDLPRWVQSVVREEWTSEVFDAELMRYENIEEEMVQLLQIGVACVATAPDQRPKMSQVAKMIEEIRHFDTDENVRTSSSKSNELTSPQRSPVKAKGF